MPEIRFYRASGDFGFLSNLFRLEVPLWLPDEFDESAKLVRKASHFQTSEAAYQYGKPRKQEVADWIASAPAPHLCAAAAHALFVFDVRPNWNQLKVARMRWVLGLKFDRTERYSLWRSLLDTGDATLIEASSMDAFWGAGKKGNGMNMLGKLLMEVRGEPTTPVLSRRQLWLRHSRVTANDGAVECGSILSHSRQKCNKPVPKSEGSGAASKIASATQGGFDSHRIDASTCHAAVRPG